jgi:hypothetical protein
VRRVDRGAGGFIVDCTREMILAAAEMNLVQNYWVALATSTG